MKSEPDECSIDDALAAPKRITPWTGVRNYQARNFMRDEMQPGDRGFFYHSSCEEPGIAGIVEVSKGAYPDKTQFDRKSRYYDPGAARAVGTALATNPVPLIIPCHRVVKSDGTLGGYSFPGVKKEWLLDLERSVTRIVGCTSTHIYCRRGCPHDFRVRDANRVSFASVAEAKTAGYRACLVCEPS